ncbi:MAG: FkbM family methyltransferase [Hyphomicrobiaceae bacterium]|nr:FkbM family methyltransferase [Hyphomicrobiaceae bacterium]
MLIAFGHRMPINWLGRRGASFVRSALKRMRSAPIDGSRLGLRLRLNTSGNASERRLLVSPQFFDPEVLEFLKNALKPGFVFVDIGANAGTYSLFVGTRVGPSGTLVAVEPHPVALQRLKFNLSINGLDWAHVAPVALSDSDGSIDLHINPRNIGSTSARENQQSGIESETFSVPCRTLASLAAELNLTHIDAIKADIEGFEDRVLEPFFDQAPRAIWPQILIVEDGRLAWKTDFLSKLAGKGYRIVLETGGNIVLTRPDDQTSARS